MSEFLVLQHIECEDLGTIGDAMSRRGIGYNYVRLFDGEPVPSSLYKYSGLIILGGPMNVYEEDKYPYLKDEDILIKKAINKDTPLLGICLGGQLIAKATGVKVRKGARKEIGWYKLNLTRHGMQDRAFKVLPDELTVFQWHGDTFDIPAGAAHLAGSGLFPNQAYRVGNKVYGLQFHLEVTQEMIRRWISEYQEELSSIDYIDAKRIINEIPEYIDNLTRFANLFYERFFYPPKEAHIPIR
jgi:GMP synthase-like glutamine amidotransferase